MFIRMMFYDEGMGAHNSFLFGIIIITNAAFYVCLGLGVWPLWERYRLRKNTRVIR